MNNNWKIDFEPIGKRIEVDHTCTLLEAAHSAGIELASICGGTGTCEQCRVQILSGNAAPANLVERNTYSNDMIQKGWRLACQTEVQDSLKVYIPPDSLTTPQRLQTEGIEEIREFIPLFKVVELKTASPDSQSDPQNSQNKPELIFDASQKKLHADFENKYIQAKNGLKVVIKNNQAVYFCEPSENIYGIAVDLGTTKIAAYLMDLEKNSIAVKSSAPNPQIHYGEDVISRIQYCMEHPEGSKLLQEKVVETLNLLLQQMCDQVNARTDQVIEGVVAGNTAMHHLFAGLPVKQLGLSPYTPSVKNAFYIDACDIGLKIFPYAKIYLPEIIAGYVGADHVTMMIGSETGESTDTVMAIDIGTNTEISLVSDGLIYSCSCASGPAFEGAHIQEGMRAADGAIERVKIDGDKVNYQTIGNLPPIGICGSGILDVIAEMRRNNIINERGNFNSHPNVRETGHLKEFVLAPAAKSGCNHDIVITKRDINEILLAKGAIQTGIEILLRTAGITADNLDRVIIAGAFGTYLNINSAIQIGMFPNLDIARFKQVGNAAGTGARMMLVSDEFRRKGTELIARTQYVELTLYPEFQKVYLQSLRFPN